MRRVPSVHETSFGTNALHRVEVVLDVDVDSMVGDDDPPVAQAHRRCTHVEDGFLDHIWWVSISIGLRMHPLSSSDDQTLLWFMGDSPW